MFHKLTALTLCLICLAMALLIFRQQRLELANRNASLLNETRLARQEIWEAQARGATLLHPSRLRQRLQDRNLQLEPQIVSPDDLGWSEPMNPGENLQ